LRTSHELLVSETLLEDQGIEAGRDKEAAESAAIQRSRGRTEMSIAAIFPLRSIFRNFNLQSFDLQKEARQVFFVANVQFP